MFVAGVNLIIPEQSNLLLPLFLYIIIIIIPPLYHIVIQQVQQRFLGLMIIKEVIEQVAPNVYHFLPHRMRGDDRRGSGRGKNGDDLTASSYSNSRNGANDSPQLLIPPATSLSAATLEKWLLYRDVVGSVFGGAASHQDLAARTDVVLVFLAQRGALTLAHLKPIWASASVAHETVARVLNELILRLVPVLSPSLRMQLFGLITATVAAATATSATGSSSILAASLSVPQSGLSSSSSSSSSSSGAAPTCTCLPCQCCGLCRRIRFFFVRICISDISYIIVHLSSPNMPFVFAPRHRHWRSYYDRRRQRRRRRDVHRRGRRHRRRRLFDRRHAGCHEDKQRIVCQAYEAYGVCAC